MHKLIAAVATWIVATIASAGYGGVAFLMAIESACIPLPSEIIMPFAGYLVSIHKLDLFWVATAGAIGCNLGSIVAYEAGRWGGRPLVERYGRYLLVSTHDLDRADAFFDRFGSITVLVCRLLPVVRSFIAFPAGVARMNLVRFHIYTFVGSWPFCYALAYVGEKLGDAWQTDPRLHAAFEKLDVVVVGALVVAAIAFLLHKVHKSRRPTR